MSDLIEQLRNIAIVPVIEIEDPAKAVALAKALNLTRVSAPLFVRPESGLNDNLNGVERPVGFDIKNGEIMILSFDGVSKEALKYVLDGKIACIGECNPLHGPRVADVISIIEEGQTPQKLQFVSEDIYVHDDAVQIFTVDGRKYDVKKMTRDLANTKAQQFGN